MIKRMWEREFGARLRREGNRTIAGEGKMKDKGAGRKTAIENIMEEGKVSE